MRQARMFSTIPPFEGELDDPGSGIKWKSWLRSFELFAKANQIEDESDKFNWMLHCAGQKVQSIYYTLPEEQREIKRGPLSTGYVPFEATEYSDAVAKLDKFFEPKRNTSFERHIFRQMKQKKNERIDTFVMRLREQAERCDFNEQEEESIKDQVTGGCSSNLLRRKILERGERTLDEILSQARILEVVEKQQKSFEGRDEDVPKTETIDTKENNSSEVCKIGTGQKFTWRNREQTNRNSECGRCGRNGHQASDIKCPARGKECAKCGGKDHFARRCFSRITKPNNSFKRKAIDRSNEPPEKFKMESTPVNMIDKTFVGSTMSHDEDIFATGTRM